MIHRKLRVDARGRMRSGACLVVALLAGACGGGGGGGGAGSSSSSFYVTDVKYGRLVDDGTGQKLISPLTTVTLDPVTGRIVPGSIVGLAPDVDVTMPQTFAIGADYLPRVVPRNGVIQVEFSGAIDDRSIVADALDADGHVVSQGSVQVRLEDGRGVAVALIHPASNVLWIDPTVANAFGFPPSPIDFAPDGSPRADATGFLKLIFPSAIRDTSGRLILPVLQNTRGATIGPRTDHLGESDTPIGFNPGNRVLDFIAQNQLIPTGETFNGFLPDIAPPRIVRTVSYSHALSFGAGDSATSSLVEDVRASFSTLARGGLGEWAGAHLTLRPGLANQEIHTVLSNTHTSATITDTFATLPGDGDTFLLERNEFFEPDLNNPIDRDTFDPDDPENVRDTDLMNFVTGWEIDANGNAVNGPIALSEALPPFSELRVRFSEPMSADAFSAYENFQVTVDPPPRPSSEILSQVVLDPTQTTVAIRPTRANQASETFQIVG